MTATEPHDSLSLIEAHLARAGACPKEIEEAVARLRRDHLKAQETAEACANANANMAELYGDLEDALELVKEREAAAAAAHRTIRDMLQTMQQGLFTMEPDLTVGAEYSAHLETILEQNELAGLGLDELLLQHAALTDDERSTILGTLAMSFGCPAFLFEVNNHVLPRELNRSTPSGFQVLELDWSVIEDDNDDVAKVMLCLRDVTQLRTLQREAAEQREQLEIIGEIISNPQVAFERALAECERLANFVSEEAAATLDLDTRTVLMRNLHTIKGIARNHGLKKLSDVVHHAEEAMKEEENEDVQAGVVADTVHGAVMQYRTVNTQALGRQADQVQLSDERRSRARTLVESARRKGFTPDSVNEHRHILAELGNLLDTELMQLEEFCVPLRQCASRVSTELGKPALHVEIDGAGWLQPSQVSVLNKAFVHIVRNAADHGIEDAATRADLGKPEQGTLSIQVMTTAESIDLLIRDDGAGLHLDALRSKRPHATDNEVAEVIFTDGVSTKEQATLVSGRGVGMSAVRDIVERAGGRVWVELEEPRSSGYRGFATHISLPVAATKPTTLPRRPPLEPMPEAPPETPCPPRMETRST